MAEKGKAVYRIVINGSQDAIFRELSSTDRPLGAIFNLRMHTTGLRPGGRMQMRTLKAIVESGRPPLGTRLMYAMFGAMEFVLPKRTKTENWPLEGRK